MSIRRDGGSLEERKMQFRLGICPAFVAIVLASTYARANTGIQLPLNQYQAGTETTTLVPNGNFEAVVAGDAAPPWVEMGGGMSAGAHIGGNYNAAVMGAVAATGGPVDLTQYRQPITPVQMNPAVDNVLSAYLWAFGNPGPPPHNISDFDPGDMAIVELGDGVKTVNIILEPIALDNGSAADGYFVYTTIPAGTFPGGANLDVRVDLDTPGGTFPPIVDQFDNIAITPAALFVPPSLIPEPASAVLLCGAGLFNLARRRRV
jgi:hypothetical protein